ncbi:MAG: FtsH protease activity modulator HflK [Pseudomonadota bacterium]
MPFNSNSGGGGGGPWGSGPRGPNKGGGGPWGGGPSGGGGGGGGQGGGQGPDLDDLLRKGGERLRVILGGKGGGGGFGGAGGPGLGGYEKYVPYVLVGIVALLWSVMSLYRVETGQQSVELFLGEYSQTGTDGLNFAPWPIVTHEIVETERERVVDIGTDRTGDRGLMLTGDENIVDIDFSVVWNVADPRAFLFNLREANDTIGAVSESAMREVIARSELRPILSRDRAEIASQVQSLIQGTLNEYESGVNIVRVIFDDADPPPEVLDAFRDVQAAEQDRDTAEKRADAYANEKLAGARGQVAEILQSAEAYRAQVVNQAQGEAARFVSVYTEYANAPEVTRKRLYIETIERVFADVDKVLIDESAVGGGNGQGVIPFLPLNELNRGNRPSERPDNRPMTPRPSPGGSFSDNAPASVSTITTQGVN